MRISTNQFYNLNSNHMSRLQTTSNQTLMQLSTGKRVDTAADDSSAAIVLDNLKQQDQQLEQFQNNINLANNRLMQQESYMGEYGNVLLSLRDKVLQGNDGALDASGRAALALDIEEGLKSVLAIANSRDENGNFIFSGHQGSQKPFIEGADGKVHYMGDSGRRRAEVAEGVTLPVSESGERIFMNPSNASGPYRADYGSATMEGELFLERSQILYPSEHVAGPMQLQFGEDADGNTTIQVFDSNNTALLADDTLFDAGSQLQVNGMALSFSGSPANGDTMTLYEQDTMDVFSSLQTVVGLLRDPEGMSGFKTQAIYAQALDDISSAQAEASSVQAETGNYLKSLDSYLDQHQSMKLVNAQAKSSLEDLDYAEAITRLEQQSLALNAVTQSFAKLQNISLFNYI